MKPFDAAGKPQESAPENDDSQVNAAGHGHDPAQLQAMKAHLDLVLLALEALAHISSDDVLQAAQALGLADILADRITLWRWRQSSPLRKGKGGRKKLDLDEARAMTLICADLAGRYQGQIRQAVSDLEAFSRTQRPLHQAPLIGDYLDGFYTFYQERIHSESASESEPPLAKVAKAKSVTKSVTDAETQNLALKLLIDLLFYSAPSGARRLWSALLERSLREQ